MHYAKCYPHRRSAWFRLHSWHSECRPRSPRVSASLGVRAHSGRVHQGILRGISRGPHLCPDGIGLGTRTTSAFHTPLSPGVCVLRRQESMRQISWNYLNLTNRGEPQWRIGITGKASFWWRQLGACAFAGFCPGAGQMRRSDLCLSATESK